MGDSGQTWNLLSGDFLLRFITLLVAGSVQVCVLVRIALTSRICSPGEISILSVQFTADLVGIGTGLLTVYFKGYIIFFF